MQSKQHLPRPESSVINLQLGAEHKSRDLDNWINYIQRLHYRTMDLTLDRVRTVIDRITGKNIPFRVISVAGTNGKGSVAHMVESIFRHAGYSTGLYTSPHLVDFNERFVVDGKQISNADVLKAFQRVEACRGEVPLTFFEYGTAIAVDYFIQRNVDVAVFEVGLGGRKDAVNIMEADIACITSIGTDHEKWLGSTREQIGYEKAGILRTDQLAVCTDSDLPQSVRKTAEELSLKLHVIGEDFTSEFKWDRWSVRLRLQDVQVELSDIPKPPISGRCQKDNATGAAAIALLARQMFDLPDNAIRSGIEATRIHGRLQVVQESPQVLLDVAHNIESIREMADYLDRHPVGGKNIALMSVLSEKPIELMSEAIAHVFDEWHLCGIHDERGITARQLHRRVQPVLSENCSIELHFDVRSGFESILSRVSASDRIVVFGSFLTVGEVMQRYRDQEPGKL